MSKYRVISIIHLIYRNPSPDIVSIISVRKTARSAEHAGEMLNNLREMCFAEYSNNSDIEKFYIYTKILYTTKDRADHHYQRLVDHVRRTQRSFSAPRVSRWRRLRLG